MRAWIGLMLLGFVVGGCSDNTSTSTDMTVRDMVSVPTSATVQVGPSGSNTFSPQSVTIRAGGTVTWNFQGSGFNHTVTSGTPGAPDGKFCNGTTTPSVTICGAASTNPATNTGTYTVTFATAGSNPYYCRPHGSMGMTGTVTVVP